MLEKTPATAQLVFIDEEAELMEEPEELVETKPVDIPSIGPLDKRKPDSISDDDVDGGVLVESPRSNSTDATLKAESKVMAAEVKAVTEGVKRVKLNLPSNDRNNDIDGKSTSKRRMPPRIRRSSTTIFSHSTIDAPAAPSRQTSGRLFSLPDLMDESQNPPQLRRTSTSGPRPLPPPKPQFRPLQRRATTPAEAKPSRQVSRSSSCITLPSLDITQNSTQMCRESELLLDLLNTLRNYWPDRPYAVMNHLRTSLLIALAVYDDEGPTKPLFASDHGSTASINKVVCRFRRNRVDKEPIDLCLVLWDPAFMSFREQCVLQETHRYKVQQSGRSSEWPSAQRVTWYPSWEPTSNLPEDTAEEFSVEKEKFWKEDGELTFEVAVSDGDWC
ncbi:hypothetical protein ABW20_dc0106719 [Dactylellina cionopaga]|nr:hypothetical protein ABW20_dc0106719 [Dactylellina cionopaga]